MDTTRASTARCSSRRTPTWAVRAKSTTSTRGRRGRAAAFAPGFDLANYTVVSFANFPTANVQVANGLQSPLVREFTRRARPPARSAGAREGDLRVAQDVELRRGLRQPDERRRQRAAGRRAHQPRARQHRRPVALEYQAAIFQTGYRMADRICDGRALHAAGRRTTATSRVKRPTSLASRRSTATSRRSSARRSIG